MFSLSNCIRIKEYCFPIFLSIKYSSLPVFILYSLFLLIFIKGANNFDLDCMYAVLSALVTSVQRSTEKW